MKYGERKYIGTTKIIPLWVRNLDRLKSTNGMKSVQNSEEQYDMKSPYSPVRDNTV